MGALAAEFVRVALTGSQCGGAGLAAAELVASGEDAQSVILLAGMSRDADPEDVRRLILSWGEERGFHRPSDESSRLQLAGLCTALIASGDLGPFEGAELIRTHLFWDLPEDMARPFGGFVSFAVDWVERPDHRAATEAAIVNEARELTHEIQQENE